MVRRYVPDTGHIVWLDFDPQAGREQAGHRPALVLSPFEYNNTTGLMVCCPLTSQVKGYPFEVVFTDAEGGESAVLSDQVKSLDWRVRKAEHKGQIGADEVAEVKAKISALLDLASSPRVIVTGGVTGQVASGNIVNNQADVMYFGKANRKK